MMNQIWIPLVLLFSLAPHSAVAQQKTSIVGTWNLISYEDIQDTKTKSKPVYPWGRHPSGMLIYDDTGHMAVQIQRMPVKRSFAKTETVLTNSDRIDMIASYTAYFGTYSVDWQRSTVTHHVTGNLFPFYIGTDQKKTFELNGDRFILKVSWVVNGVHWNGIRVFERMRPLDH